MTRTARLELDGKTLELPIIEGTEHEKAIDVASFARRRDTSPSTSRIANTGSCQSRITFIDGEKGVLRYRGVPIEDMAETSTFVEAAYSSFTGSCRRSPSASSSRTAHQVPEPPRGHEVPLRGLPVLGASHGHPAGHDLRCQLLHPGADQRAYRPEVFDEQAARLLSQVRTLAAYAYRKSRGLPSVYPRRRYWYRENFLHLMFSMPDEDYELGREVVDALDLILLLHADHEQNCSTATVRMVASSARNLFASAAAGVCALWGPRHGGANQQPSRCSAESPRRATTARGSSRRSSARTACTRRSSWASVTASTRRTIRGRASSSSAATSCWRRSAGSDPLLDIAKKLEEAALHDPYFIERNLYPNVDFYSGIIMQAIGIPLEMFTVIFAIGRMPGWIANYKEVAEESRAAGSTDPGRSIRGRRWPATSRSGVDRLLPPPAVGPTFATITGTRAPLVRGGGRREFAYGVAVAVGP